ncbi:MAG: glutathione S-transferase family protein [Candidatus Lambdaproteobacteria bacterium]|nr:glutathione S-transferase family protein [Candidatus Lambdaproteobacteria bacterium]
MGSLINGEWIKTPRPIDPQGRFRRAETQYRNWITADGRSGFKAEADRYHLYVSWACPWAHRTLLLRKLKGLEHAIGLSVVDHYMSDEGWEFTDRPGTIPDTVNHTRYVREIYVKSRPDYTGRASVPVLWDKQRNVIVNNESREIVRMLDLEFDGIARRDVTFCPEHLREQIDRTIEALYEPINNGVYKSGFAKSQAAYEEAVTALFQALDRWEAVLERQRYLCGDVVTEADWCLFTTLVRFDLVYHGHFKCNLRRLADYPMLWNYLKELCQLPGVAETCNLEHMKAHYYGSHPTVNPTGIVPLGPAQYAEQLAAPHDRATRRYSS